MSFSLLLLSFYSYVSSFDDFHSRKESIYRIISTLDSGGKKTDFASAPAALAKRLQHETEGIKEITRMNAAFKGNVVTDKMNIPIQGYYADANFFSVFDFVMIQGNPLNALSNPNSIVLTESVARKLVASGNLVGNTLEIEGLGIFAVTGVVKDQRRTHLWFEALVSFSTLPAQIRGEESNPDQWAEVLRSTCSARLTLKRPCRKSTVTRQSWPSRMNTALAFWNWQTSMLSTNSKRHW